MKRKFRFDEVAQKEMRQASCWLDAIQKNLGKRLIKAITDQARRIAAQPLLWAEVGSNVRQSPVHGSDYYFIYYRVYDDHILVVSVFHASREPKDW